MKPSFLPTLFKKHRIEPFVKACVSSPVRGRSERSERRAFTNGSAVLFLPLSSGRKEVFSYRFYAAFNKF